MSSERDRSLDTELSGPIPNRWLHNRLAVKSIDSLDRPSVEQERAVKMTEKSNRKNCPSPRVETAWITCLGSGQGRRSRATGGTVGTDPTQ